MLFTSCMPCHVLCKKKIFLHNEVHQIHYVSRFIKFIVSYFDSLGHVFLNELEFLCEKRSEIHG